MPLRLFSTVLIKTAYAVTHAYDVLIRTVLGNLAQLSKLDD